MKAKTNIHKYLEKIKYTVK